MKTDSKSLWLKGHGFSPEYLWKTGRFCGKHNVNNHTFRGRTRSNLSDLQWKTIIVLGKSRVSSSQPNQLYQGCIWEKGWPLCPSQKLTTAFAHVLIVSNWPGWVSQSVSVEKRWPAEGDKGAPAWWVTLLAEPAFFFSLLFLFPEASLFSWLRRSCLRPSAEHVSACGRRNEAPRRTREKTSGTQGKLGYASDPSTWR